MSFHEKIHLLLSGLSSVRIMIYMDGIIAASMYDELLGSFISYIKTINTTKISITTKLEVVILCSTEGACTSLEEALRENGILVKTQRAIMYGSFGGGALAANDCFAIHHASEWVFHKYERHFPLVGSKNGELYPSAQVASPALATDPSLYDPQHPVVALHYESLLLTGTNIEALCKLLQTKGKCTAVYVMGASFSYGVTTKSVDELLPYKDRILLICSGNSLSLRNFPYRIDLRGIGLLERDLLDALVLLWSAIGPPTAKIDPRATHNKKAPIIDFDTKGAGFLRNKRSSRLDTTACPSSASAIGPGALDTQAVHTEMVNDVLGNTPPTTDHSTIPPEPIADARNCGSSGIDGGIYCADEAEEWIQLMSFLRADNSKIGSTPHGTNGEIRSGESQSGNVASIDAEFSQCRKKSANSQDIFNGIGTGSVQSDPNPDAIGCASDVINDKARPFLSKLKERVLQFDGQIKNSARDVCDRILGRDRKANVADCSKSPADNGINDTAEHMSKLFSGNFRKSTDTTDLRKSMSAALDNDIQIAREPSYYVKFSRKDYDERSKVIFIDARNVPDRNLAILLKAIDGIKGKRVSVHLFSCNKEVSDKIKAANHYRDLDPQRARFKRITQVEISYVSEVASVRQIMHMIIQKKHITQGAFLLQNGRNYNAMQPVKKRANWRGVLMEKGSYYDNDRALSAFPYDDDRGGNVSVRSLSPFEVPHMVFTIDEKHGNVVIEAEYGKCSGGNKSGDLTHPESEPKEPDVCGIVMKGGELFCTINGGEIGRIFGNDFASPEYIEEIKNATPMLLILQTAKVMAYIATTLKEIDNRINSIKDTNWQAYYKRSFMPLNKELLTTWQTLSKFDLKTIPVDETAQLQLAEEMIGISRCGLKKMLIHCYSIGSRPLALYGILRLLALIVREFFRWLVADKYDDDKEFNSKIEQLSQGCGALLDVTLNRGGCADEIKKNCTDIKALVRKALSASDEVAQLYGVPDKVSGLEGTCDELNLCDNECFTDINEPHYAEPAMRQEANAEVENLGDYHYNVNNYPSSALDDHDITVFESNSQRSSYTGIRLL